MTPLTAIDTYPIFYELVEWLVAISSQGRLVHQSYPVIGSSSTLTDITQDREITIYGLPQKEWSPRVRYDPGRPDVAGIIAKEAATPSLLILSKQPPSRESSSAYAHQQCARISRCKPKSVKLCVTVAGWRT